MSRIICLLRAVNVGGRQVKMDQLRAMASGLGFVGAQTLLASGNLVIEAGELTAQTAAEKLEAGFEAQFGFRSEFICRTAAEWRAIMDACPFPEDHAARGNRLLALVSQGAPAPDVVDRLKAIAVDGERVARTGEVVWISFTDDGMGRSKLMGASTLKAFRTPVTGRNWNTVVKLAALAEA